MEELIEGLTLTREEIAKLRNYQHAVQQQRSIIFVSPTDYVRLTKRSSQKKSK